MSNSYFKFKQFTVHQGNCAMKVSTDACIQGAWTPIDGSIKRILDIGSGSGLLSLMLAQRSNNAIIDAIELDEASVMESANNINISPWAERINVTQADARDYVFAHQYDLVICNPPFFSNSLLGDNEKRNHVRHTLSLTYIDLFAVIEKVISINGYASVLLPTAEHKTWETIVKNAGWGFRSILYVQPRIDLPCNRVISICSRVPVNELVETMQIYNPDKSYTDNFRKLMKPFYLKM